MEDDEGSEKVIMIGRYVADYSLPPEGVEVPADVDALIARSRVVSVRTLRDTLSDAPREGLMSPES